MAYVSKDLKAKVAPLIKEICKKYGIKATISVSNHATLCLNISSGSINFFGSYIGRNQGHTEVNPYHFTNSFSGIALRFLAEIHDVLNIENYDRSDSQSDYFDVGYYVSVNIGKWNKPYTITA